MQWLTPAGMAFSNGASSSTTKADLPPSSRHTFLIVGAGHGGDAAARGLRPGEADHVDGRMRRDRLADHAALARHHVEHPGGQADLSGRLGEDEGAERRQLGRLEHHRAAGGERRRDLADHLVQRVVPRRDAADDADRLLHDQRVAELSLRAWPRGGTARWRRPSRPGTRPAPWWRSRSPCRPRGRSPARCRARAPAAPRRASRATPHAPRRRSRPTGRRTRDVRRWRQRPRRPAVPRGTRPMACSVDDETTSIASPPDDVRQSPSMKSRSCTSISRLYYLAARG